MRDRFVELTVAKTMGTPEWSVQFSKQNVNLDDSIGNGLVYESVTAGSTHNLILCFMQAILTSHVKQY